MIAPLPESVQPHFLVIGAGRSGTTSIHSYLSQHPRLFLPPKNPSYFYATDLTGSRLADHPALIPPYFVSSSSAYARFCRGPLQLSTWGSVPCLPRLNTGSQSDCQCPACGQADSHPSQPH